MSSLAGSPNSSGLRVNQQAMYARAIVAIRSFAPIRVASLFQSGGQTAYCPRGAILKWKRDEGFQQVSETFEIFPQCCM